MPELEGPKTEMLNFVEGKVQFESAKASGIAADGAVVEFHPASGGSPDLKITGTVDEGTYNLKTVEGGVTKFGAPEGDYIVTIARPAGSTVGKQKIAIPPQYADKKSSELKAHVEEGKQTIDFMLK